MNRSRIFALVATLLVLAGAGLLLALGAAKHRHEATLDGGKLAFTAPLPSKIPPGTKLIIGDQQTEAVLEYTGWIKDLPFQIQWARISGGPEVTEAFNAKALDVGSGANVPPIHATWVGLPVKIITFRQRQDPLNHPSFVYGLSPKSGIRTLADLRGKKIAFSRSQVQGEIILKTLKAEGLTSKDVQLVELPSSIGGDVYTNALAGNLVDIAPIGAGIVARRYVQKFGKDGGKIINHEPFRDDGANLYVPASALQDPAKAAALALYVQYWGRVQAWIQLHKEEWIQQYYMKNQGLSHDDAEFIVDAVGDPDIPENWDGAVQVQQDAINILSGEVGKAPFDAETLFDRRFQAIGANAYRAELAKEQAK